MGVKRSEYIKEAAVPQTTSYIADLLNLDTGDQNNGNHGSQTSALDDLLGSVSKPKEETKSKSIVGSASPMDLLEMETSS